MGRGGSLLANQNAAAGAGGALAGEVMADVIAKELYSKKPNQLNREEKEVVSSVSQAAGALVGGAAAIVVKELV